MKQTAKQIKDAMENIRKQMTSVKNNSETKLKQGLKTLRENMKILRARILTIQAKLNLVSESTYYSQDERERLNKLFEEVTQPQKVGGKIEEVKGKMEELLEKRANFVPAIPSEAFNHLSNEEKRRVITILKEQTKGIDTLMKTTKKNAYKLEAIELIIDNIKSDRAREAAYNDIYMY